VSGAIVGVVGGGQLARMLLEAALALDVGLSFYVRPGEEGISGWSPRVVEGPLELEALRAFARTVDVVTFEHELVHPTVLAALERDGVRLAPPAGAMAVGSDKELQRRLFASLGLAAIPSELVDRGRSERPHISPPYLLKAAHGGYDGRGLVRVDTEKDLPPTGRYLAEPILPIEAEGAVLVARSPSGAIRSWDPIRLVNLEGICVEAAWPSELPEAIERAALRAAIAIAEALDFVGVLAMEFFVVEGGLIVNEIAPRVHNSGHLTIEAAVTSQFENHLRAILDHPLGDTSPLSPAAMVNLLGRIADRTSPSRVRVHRYGKTPRARRKLGHVTALAPTVAEARQHARAAARTLGGELIRELEEVG